LGVLLDDRLRFNYHISSLCKRIKSKVHMLSRNLYLFYMDIRSILYNIFFHPLFTHLDNETDHNRLLHVFPKSIKKILNYHLPLSTSILIFNNRNKIIHPSFNNENRKYSFSIVSSKLLSLFIYSHNNSAKLSFKKHMNSNLIKLFNQCNHVWD
jgi:hypothetical protein